MKFSEYITEAKEIKDIDKFIEGIKKNCKPYLKLLNKREPMIRGMQAPGVMGIKDVRQNRRAVMFPDEAYDEMNRWLQKKGGARRDKSVICISQAHKKRGGNLAVFGAKHWIFPIGKFKYSFVRMRDMNAYVSKSGITRNELIDYFNKEAVLSQRDDLVTDKEVDDMFSHNKNFNEAYDNGYEMWFQCKQYYYYEYLYKYDARIQRQLGLIF